jgi:hypothetical protein
VAAGTTGAGRSVLCFFTIIVRGIVTCWIIIIENYYNQFLSRIKFIVILLSAYTCHLVYNTKYHLLVLCLTFERYESLLY